MHTATHTAHGDAHSTRRRTQHTATHTAHSDAHRKRAQHAVHRITRSRANAFGSRRGRGCERWNSHARQRRAFSVSGTRGYVTHVTANRHPDGPGRVSAALRGRPATARNPTPTPHTLPPLDTPSDILPRPSALLENN